MKKTLKTLTAFLLLFALVSSIRPIQPLTDTSTGTGITIYGDDDDSNHEIISSK